MHVLKIRITIQFLSGWWFGTWILWLSIYWMSSSQLTNSYFFIGVGQPPTSAWNGWKIIGCKTTDGTCGPGETKNPYGAWGTVSLGQTPSWHVKRPHPTSEFEKSWIHYSRHIQSWIGRCMDISENGEPPNHPHFTILDHFSIETHCFGDSSVSRTPYIYIDR
jgi:hypothetical protein